MVYKKDHAPKVARLTPGELVPEKSERKDENGAWFVRGSKPTLPDENAA